MTELFSVKHAYKRCQVKLYRKLKSKQVFLVEKLSVWKYGYIGVTANFYTVPLNLTNFPALGTKAE